MALGLVDNVAQQILSKYCMSSGIARGFVFLHSSFHSILYGYSESKSMASEHELPDRLIQFIRATLHRNNLMA